MGLSIKTNEEEWSQEFSIAWNVFTKSADTKRTNFCEWN
jgi:hypothetical protein